MRRFLVLALALAGCHSDNAVSDGGVDQGFVTTQFDLGCATSGAEAKLVPVNLVVLLDRSGSMGDGVNGDPSLKWTPVTQAMEAFFADPQSLGMSASLAFFPDIPNPTDQCNSSWYYPPASPGTVTMRTLPDTSSFSQAIGATTPSGMTPTRPGVMGSIDYAKDVRDGNPGSRTAIVLVTDGDPDVCDSSVPDTALEVAKVAGTIPTYVIGVGDSIASLQQIASAGGTGMPTFVSVGNAAQTAADFQKALEAIRGLVLTCDFPIPAPPQGMTLDFMSVNVLYTPSGAGQEQLLYDSACSTGVGWHYDDPQNPTQVQLCAQSCDQVKQDHGGKIDVVFGCATAGNLIQ
jgi:hypothetical protein